MADWQQKKSVLNWKKGVIKIILGFDDLILEDLQDN